MVNRAPGTGLVSEAVLQASLSGAIIPTGVTAALQVPYRDTASTVKWTAATAVVARALGWRIVNDYAATPGAVASQAETQNALDTLPVNGTAFFEGNYTWTGTVYAKTVGFQCTGPSATFAGRIKVGAVGGPTTNGVVMASSRLEAGGTIHHMNFYRALDKTTYPTKGYADGSWFIAMDRARDVEVTDCHFYGAAWPIYLMPNGTAANHDFSSINIHHNFFNECDWALYHTFDTATPAPGAWQCLADSYFCSNTVNRSYVGMVYLQGADGFFIESNTHFMINYNSNTNARFQEKQQNIRIDWCDWLHIHNNNLFESGLESVLLDHCRHARITGNLFAWPGQRVPSDAVRIISNSGGAYATGEYAAVTFSGNDGTYYSRDFFSAAGDFGALSLVGNTNLYKGDADRYIGNGTTDTTQAARRATISALNHYRYNLGSVTSLPASQINITDGALTRTDSTSGTAKYVHLDLLPNHALSPYVLGMGPYAGTGSVLVPKLTFAATTAQTLFQMRGQADNTGTFGGLILVVMRSLSGSNKEAQYLLLVFKPASGASSILDISAGGMGPYTAGAAADDPSFTFTMSAGGSLIATPIASTASATSGSTSNDFLVAGTYLGNLIAG